MNFPIPGALNADHPTAQQIIDREGLAGKLTDKVILITGASAGIGVVTAQALYHTGAHIFLAARDQAKAAKVKQDIESDGLDGKGRIVLLHLDMESLDSVRQCAKDFLSASKQLNILICNAGVMAVPEGKTKEGFETQFGVNHLAHFLLFQQLQDTLLASSTPAFNSRVVILSSNGHAMSPILWDDIHQHNTQYNKWVAYAQSKTANVHMATEIERQYGSRGLHSTVIHPGFIPNTSLGRDLTADDISFLSSRKGVDTILKTSEQGAATTVWAAVSKEWEGKGGKYLEDVGVSVPETEESKLLFRGYAAHAYDEEQARRLWKESLVMVELKDDNSF